MSESQTNPPVPATPLDVEACVRLLERQAELAANRSAADRDYAERHEGTHPHHAAEYHATAAKYMEEAKLLRALASALPGMGKDSERWRYMRGVAWHEVRPAELPGDLAATIYRLTGGVRHPTAEHLDSAVDNLIAARAAQPGETSADAT